MPPATVRDIFDERVTAFEATTDVDTAIETIRTATTGSGRTVYYAYILGDDRKLEGVVSLRELLNADGERPLEEVATEDVVTVNISDPIGEVGTVFAENKFMAVPVVNDDGELLGSIHAAALIEAVEEPKEVLQEAIRDIEYDPDEESAYECYSCGTVITATGNPGECPNCADQLRNKKMPLE